VHDDIPVMLIDEGDKWVQTKTEEPCPSRPSVKESLQPAIQQSIIDGDEQAAEAAWQLVAHLSPAQQTQALAALQKPMLGRPISRQALVGEKCRLERDRTRGCSRPAGTGRLEITTQACASVRPWRCANTLIRGPFQRWPPAWATATRSPPAWQPMPWRQPANCRPLPDRGAANGPQAARLEAARLAAWAIKALYRPCSRLWMTDRP
jgi:hypothetical protein